MCLGIKCGGPHRVTLAPILINPKILDKATLLCKISPTIAIFKSFNLPNFSYKLIISNIACVGWPCFPSPALITTASTKLVKRGEPVFCCYCGSTNFHRFKLGFDRIFWVEEVKDKNQIKAFEVAVKSQQAALEVLRPGVTAEEVHAAYAETIQSEGYPYPTFRCGRGTGFSFLEEPQLVVGNKTVLKPGMVFAVDGGSSAKDFRGQVGDSFIITEDGYEQITHHSKAIEDLIIN